VILGGPHRRAGLLLVVFAYAAVLCLSPRLHHDFDCHLKSPSHCTACMANPAASREADVVDPSAVVLPSAGAVERPRPARLESGCRVVLQGRAPPF
jgi:hypothetical protein